MPVKDDIKHILQLTIGAYFMARNYRMSGLSQKKNKLLKIGDL